MILRLKVAERPDVASPDGGETSIEEAIAPFTCATVNLTNGDWFFDNDFYVNLAGRGLLTVFSIKFNLNM